MAITLGLVEAVDDNGVYVSMPGSRGVLRGPYRSLSTVATGNTALVNETRDGEQVVVGPCSGGDGMISVKSFGAVGDGVTDDTAAIQAGVDATAGVAGLLFTRGEYLISDTVTVPSGATLIGRAGAELKYSDAGTAKAIEVTGSDVTIDGLTVTGPRSVAATQISEYGIYVSGASTGSRVERLRLRNLTLSMWGWSGIHIKWVSDFTIDGCHIHDIGFQGISGLSVEQGRIADCHIHDILCPVAYSSNGYGIILNHDGSNLSTDPVCSDVVISGNVVRNVVDWEGIDTHGGVRMSIVDNVVLGCAIGIALVTNTTGSVSDVTVSGNVVDSLLDDGSASHSITIDGEDGDLGSAVITGNVLSRHSAVFVNDTAGVVIADNLFNRPSPRGIDFWSDNVGFAVTGNTFIDCWSDGDHAAAVLLYQEDNSGVVAGNTMVTTGEVSATYVNHYGVQDQQGTSGGSDVLISGNDFRVAAGSAVGGSGSGGISTSVGESGTKVGFYGAPPVTKPTVTGSRGGNAALASLLTQLASLGLITDSSS